MSLLFGSGDLDTSIVPDVFGLWAFDPLEPISRMLPGETQHRMGDVSRDVCEVTQSFLGSSVLAAVL